ncbi:protein LTV1 homolog [Sitodiplosis mosellana]|uniref:protein LTV1 homolog n=1 Tax=Sitodiplosis mosellana TaxID=263140 RepID=UPI002444D2B1|nr:protein LTV1 homolog [Sitodiplosis mosellana]
MPKKSKRCFIDKKNAVTFHLVHRSQQDPLIADETAPQHVLLESNAQPTQVKKNETPEERKKRKTEEQKYGIYFDDDYDYLQHLRTKEEHSDVHWEYIPPANLKNKPNEEGESKAKSVGFALPSSVFASEFEEDEGLLRKAALHVGPRPDLDPDIVAALDDDVEFDKPDDDIDDYFMELAAGGQEGCDDYEEGDFDGDYDEYSDMDSNFDGQSFDGDEDENGDRLAPLRGCRMPNFDDGEETKSRFTEYSMSSSVIRRNEQLSLLDDRFEKFYENYDDDELGALDMEEIEGHVEMSDDLLNQCMVELNRDGNELPYDKKWDEQRIKKMLEEESSEEEMVELEVNEDEPGKKWDCESVLTMNSNAYNHPKLISEPRRRKGSKIVINPKTGVPMNVFNGENTQLTLKSVAKFNTDNINNASKTGPKSLCDQSVLSTLSVLSIRPKDEAPEEKRQRKRLLKEYRTERRIERKANQDAFKEEKKRQTQIGLNNRNNLQGNRIL